MFVCVSLNSSLSGQARVKLDMIRMPGTIHNKQKDVFPTFATVRTLRGQMRLVFSHQEHKEHKP